MVRRNRRVKRSIFKKIFITLGVILVIFAGIIIYFVVKDFKQEEVLKQELINYSNMDLASDDYTIFVKTKGDYAYIEEAVKKFYKELSDNVKIINYYMSDEELKNVLAPDRLVSERPDFIKSYAVIKKDRTNVIKALEKISKLCEEETVKNIIDKEKVDDYYYDLYKELMLTKKDIEDLKETKEKMEELSKNLNLFFDKVVEILDLLKNNDSSWEYHDNQLFFSTDELVDKYNGLYKDLVDIASKFDSKEDTSKKDNPKDIVA